MKLALHRSVTFWSGILVMAILCLMWRHSLERSSSLTWRGRQLHVELTSVQARHLIPYSRPHSDRVQAEPFGAPQFYKLENYDVFILPHWLLILAVALPWSALLIWRARGRKRIVAP